MDLKFKDNSKLKTAPFTQLEYIESTGTQYINTGISAPNGFKIEIEYQYTEIESNYRILVGSINASSPYCRNMVGKDNYGRFFIGNKIGDWGVSGVSTNKTKIIASTVDASAITVDGSTVAMQRIATYNDQTQSAYNLYVFGNNSANSFSQSVKIKLFYLKIYDYQDNIVREFIPAKDLNDVVCLYDRVSETFFYNQGTGDFIAGPPVKSVLPETILLKTTTLYHKNTPNIDGLQLLNSILNYQKTHQEEVKEYYYPTTQLWQDIVTEYPDIVQYYNMNHKLCILICEADDPEQFTEDLLQLFEDYPDITDVIIDNPEVVHSLVDTGYETFLTSSGTQYIDTDISFPNGFRIETSFKQTNNSTFYCICGAFSTNYNNYINIYNNKLRLAVGNTSYEYGNILINNQYKIDVSIRNNIGKILINGTIIADNVQMSGSYSTLSTWLFALHRTDSTAYQQFIGSIGTTKLYDKDNNLVLWLVPIENSSNPCMIDLLTGTKYLNQGTGSFTYSLEPKNA